VLFWRSFFSILFTFRFDDDLLKALLLGVLMGAEQPKKADHDDLFNAHLDQIINMEHQFVILADKIDWPSWMSRSRPILLMREDLRNPRASCLACLSSSG